MDPTCVNWVCGSAHPWMPRIPSKHLNTSCVQVVKCFHCAKRRVFLFESHLESIGFNRISHSSAHGRVSRIPQNNSKHKTTVFVEVSRRYNGAERRGFCLTPTYLEDKRRGRRTAYLRGGVCSGHLTDPLPGRYYCHRASPSLKPGS